MDRLALSNTMERVLMHIVSFGGAKKLIDGFTMTGVWLLSSSLLLPSPEENKIKNSTELQRKPYQFSSFITSFSHYELCRKNLSRRSTHTDTSGSIMAAAGVACWRRYKHVGPELIRLHVQSCLGTVSQRHRAFALQGAGRRWNKVVKHGGLGQI